jgi:hypothetical protein
LLAGDPWGRRPQSWPPSLPEEQIVAAADDDHELTNADWGKIHAMAWREPRFGKLLENDPTAAVREYLEAKYPGFDVTKIQILKLRPEPCGVDPEFLEDVNPFPPSCC